MCFTSRDVVFREDVFPFLDLKYVTSLDDNEPRCDPLVTSMISDDHDPISVMMTPSSDLDIQPFLTIDVVQSVVSDSDSHEQTTMDSSLLLGHGHRTKTPLTRLKNYVVQTTSLPYPSLTPAISTTSGTIHHISNFSNCERFPKNHHSYLVDLSAAVKPKSYKEAIKDKVWNDAMTHEYDALVLNHTWDLEELPPGKIALGCKWVYNIKLRSHGTLE